MAHNCCSNCLPLLLEYHSTSLDLERKLQLQKIELSKLQFEKQIRDLASSTLSQLPSTELQTPQPEPSFQIETPKLPDFSFDLAPEKEASLKNSLNELKSSLNSLISSAELFSSSVSSLGKSSDWKYSDTKKGDSLFTFQEGLNNLNPVPLDESKKSSLMSPLRESDLKNSKETSSGIRHIEKPSGTPVKDMLDLSDKPSSGFKAFLTLDELRSSSGRKNIFEMPDFK